MFYSCDDTKRARITTSNTQLDGLKMTGMRLGLRLRMQTHLRGYDHLWDQSPKHKGTIPEEMIREVIKSDYQDLKELISSYENERPEFIRGNGSIMTFEDDGSKQPGALCLIRNSLPIQAGNKGLNYEVAITPSHKLINPPTIIKHGQASDQEYQTRAKIKGEELDGRTGAILGPVSTITDNEYVQEAVRSVCPFLFTDFEPEDRTTRGRFRRIGAARQIGLLLGGSRVANDLEVLVGEHIGNKTYDHFKEWVEEVGNKTPYREVTRLQEKFPDLELNKYFSKD